MLTDFVCSTETRWTWQFHDGKCSAGHNLSRVLPQQHCTRGIAFLLLILLCIRYGIRKLENTLNWTNLQRERRERVLLVYSHDRIRQGRHGEDATAALRRVLSWSSVKQIYSIQSPKSWLRVAYSTICYNLLTIHSYLKKGDNYGETLAKFVKSQNTCG